MVDLEEAVVRKGRRGAGHTTRAMEEGRRRQWRRAGGDLSGEWQRGRGGGVKAEEGRGVDGQI
jgi:hypothetical protein